MASRIIDEHPHFRTFRTNPPHTPIVANPRQSTFQFFDEPTTTGRPPSTSSTQCLTVLFTKLHGPPASSTS
eukprot:3960252-Pyramimonas_sp.AAC.1